MQTPIQSHDYSIPNAPQRRIRPRHTITNQEILDTLRQSFIHVKACLDTIDVIMTHLINRQPTDSATSTRLFNEEDTADSATSTRLFNEEDTTSNGFLFSDDSQADSVS